MNMTPAETLKKRMALAMDAQRPKFELFVKIDEVAHVKGKVQPGIAQVHSPDAFANIETVAPRIVSRRPTVIYKPGKDATPEGAEANQQNFNGWWEKDGAFDKTVATVKGGLKHGVKHVRYYWKKETQEVRGYAYGPDGKPALEAQVVKDDQGNPMKGQDGKVAVIAIEYVPEELLKGKEGKFFEETTEVTTFDDPTMELISNYDIFLDPEALDVQSANWIVFRYRKSLDQLKEYGRYKNLKELERCIGSATNDGDTEFKEMSRVYSGVGVLEKDDTVDSVTCFEMWEKGKKGRRVCTVACGIVLEDWKPNPFWHGLYPISRYIDSLQDDEYWPIGEVEPVLELQYLTDTLISVDAENRIRAMDPKWKVDGDVDEREIWESSVIHTDTKNGDDANPVEVPDYTRTSAQGIEMVQGMMSNALGIFDVNRGESDPGNATASGIATVAEQGNARFDLKIKHSEQFFREMGFFVRSLYQQHKTDEWDMRVTNEEGVEEMKRFLPQDIAGNFDEEVQSGSAKPANPEADKQAALQLYQLTQPIQAQDPQFAMESLKEVLSKFQDTGKLEESLEAAFGRIQQAQQQQQAMAEQQMMAEQGMQQEQAAGEDADKRLQYFDSEEQKLNDQIAQLEQGGMQEREMGLKEASMATV